MNVSKVERDWIPVIVVNKIKDSVTLKSVRNRDTYEIHDAIIKHVRLFS
jgi:hypothetical protein